MIKKIVSFSLASALIFSLSGCSSKEVTIENKQNGGFKKYSKFGYKEKTKAIKIDINLATKEDLIKVYGVGEVIANRIIAQRNSLKGFVVMEQLNEVWGLSPEVIENINSQFCASETPVTF
jgi:DNA uptake protein ComE-like DNA-binding protein